MSSLNVHLSLNSTSETRPNIANDFIQLQNQISLDSKATVAFKSLFKNIKYVFFINYNFLYENCMKSIIRRKTMGSVQKQRAV